MRLFLCGDCEFLFRLYGLSGASGTFEKCTCIDGSYLSVTLGRHCCIYCLIRQDQLNIPPEVRGAISLRTIESICRDHKRFLDSGAKLNNAKHHNNCINEPFFNNFPLTQVIWL